MGESLSRRSFISGAVAATGVAAVAGGTMAIADTGQDAWDREADIVVCGYGGAGSIAAIAAHDMGQTFWSSKSKPPTLKIR